MKRVLLTGLSGTGKSTMIRELAALGYKAVDLDSKDWSTWTNYVRTPQELGSPVKPGRDWVWREDRVQELLCTDDADILFVSGCAENMVQFYPQFDHIILLSAPPTVMAERLKYRSNNSYGKHPDEVERILGQVETIEPLLRKSADYEIATTISVDRVVDEIISFVKG